VRDPSGWSRRAPFNFLPDDAREIGTTRSVQQNGRSMGVILLRHVVLLDYPPPDQVVSGVSYSVVGLTRWRGNTGFPSAAGGAVK
jgi:hypothetical protein